MTVGASGRNRWRTAAVRAGLALLATLPIVGLIGCATEFRLLSRLKKALPSGEGEPLIVPGYSVRPDSGSRRTLAGSARVDITPPAGYPNMGDSLAGGVAHGYWTRLFARAFYFEDRSGHRLVLVSTDLTVMPEGLHAKVAQVVNSDWKSLVPIGGDMGVWVRDAPIPMSPDELILSATHTHQGPGNFTSSKLYNAFASLYTGFDRRLFDFLASRIATAIAAAATSAHEIPGDVSLALHVRDDVSCHPFQNDACGYRQPFLRNRMPRVFQTNPDREEVAEAWNCDEPCGPRLCADTIGFPTPATGATSRFCEPEYGWDDTRGCPRLRAVDPRMTVLEVWKSTNGGPAVIGLLVFFAAHPTVLAPDAPFNSGDFAGVAMDELQREHPDHPVAGYFNGAEGDIHMRRLRRDLRDVVRLAKLFERSVFETVATPPVHVDSDPGISVQHIEVTDFAAADRRDRDRRGDTVCKTPVWSQAVLAPKPQYGAPALGGGEGDRTVLVDLGWREGVRGQPQGSQGPKLPGLDSSVLRNLKVTDIVAPPGDFPPRLPVSYAELGALKFGTFPAELTMTMAYRIRHLLGLDEPLPARSWFVLVGLANSYSSYVATPDEYYAQDYVGASTMWGPQEGLTLGCGLEAIKGSSSHGPRFQVPAQEFDPGPGAPTPFGPGFTGDPRTYPTEELENVLLGVDGSPAVDLPWFRWEEGSACDCDENGSFDFAAAARRRVVIEVEQGGQWAPRVVPPTWDNDGTPLPAPIPAGLRPEDDDAGHDLLTLLMEASGKARRTWASIWAAELFEPGIARKAKFRFHVFLRDAQGATADRCSEGITLNDWKSRLKEQRAKGDMPGPLAADPSCR